MDMLPNEILRMIIGFIDKKELLSVRLLNKTWQSYADEHLRTIEFSLVKDKDILELIRIASWRKKFENSIQPFIRFNIYPELRNEILNEFTYNYGKEIQSLRFEDKRHPTWGHPMNSSMLHILRDTSNIQEIYFMNTCRPVILKIEFKLNFPKLRILEFTRIDIDFMNIILNASPNVQQVKLNIARIDRDVNWEDFITILQSIANKSIEVKLKMNISNDDYYASINLQNFKDIAQIPLKITEINLQLRVRGYYSGMDMTHLNKSIQQFIQKHSRNLKHLNVHYDTTGEELWVWILDFDDMLKLKSLELSCNKSGSENSNLLETNLELAPLLKEVSITYAGLNIQQPVPSLNHLKIDSYAVSECLNRLRLIDETFRLVKLSLMYSENEVPAIDKNGEINERVQHLNNFLISQANHIRQLEIGINNSIGMDMLHVPKMRNLKTFDLNLLEKEKIKLKLHRCYSPATHIFDIKLEINNINLQMLEEIVQIPANVTDVKLELCIRRYQKNVEDLSLIQETVQEFINKHSQKFKYLNVKFSMEVHDEQLMLNINSMETLEKLDLSSEFCTKSKRSLLVVNLGLAPLLNQVLITTAELNLRHDVPLLKTFCMDADNVSPCLKLPPFIDGTVQLEEICIYFPSSKISTTGESSEADERVQLLKNIIQSQAKNLRYLYIGAKNSKRMHKLQFPKMEKLERLELNLNKMGKMEKFLLNPYHFPYLKILSLNTPLQPNWNYETLENVHTLIIKNESFLDFQNCGLNFPKLKKLHIIGTIPGTGNFLLFVFTNMTHVKELIIESGGTWNQLTGNSKDVNFFEKKFNRILNTSVPNLGNMTVLNTLKLGAKAQMPSLRAVSFLISCGKLPKLKYFEADLEYGNEKIRSRCVKIIEANNTKINFN